MPPPPLISLVSLGSELAIHVYLSKHIVSFTLLGFPLSGVPQFPSSRAGGRWQVDLVELPGTYLVGSFYCLLAQSYLSCHAPAHSNSLSPELSTFTTYVWAWRT